jgi:thermostable 8-oxoguanine DNA glycosylase
MMVAPKREGQKMSFSREPEQLAQYIKSLPDFVIHTQIDGHYNHIGAALADAVLQSNNDYERNVRPRIKRIREVYAQEPSLKDLKWRLKQITVQQYLHWNGTRKPKIFQDLVDLLEREGVNTEDDLREWLQREDSSDKLLNIHFIGQKTADYLKILVGLPTAAMDRHLFGFLKRAGIKVNSDYARGQEIVHRTADLMGVDRAHLDHSIWRYMSGGKANQKSRPASIRSRRKGIGRRMPSLPTSKSKN